MLKRSDAINLFGLILKNNFNAWGFYHDISGVNRIYPDGTYAAVFRNVRKRFVIFRHIGFMCHQAVCLAKPGPCIVIHFYAVTLVNHLTAAFLRLVLHLDNTACQHGNIILLKPVPNFLVVEFPFLVIMLSV